MKKSTKTTDKNQATASKHRPCLPLTAPIETKLRQNLKQLRCGYFTERNPNPFADIFGKVEQTRTAVFKKLQNFCRGYREHDEGAVIVLDEAGQIGGHQMLELVRLVKERNARLILSCDTRQHVHGAAVLA